MRARIPHFYSVRILRSRFNLVHRKTRRTEHERVGKTPIHLRCEKYPHGTNRSSSLLRQKGTPRNRAPLCITSCWKAASKAKVLPCSGTETLKGYYYVQFWINFISGGILVYSKRFGLYQKINMVLLLEERYWYNSHKLLDILGECTRHFSQKRGAGRQVGEGWTSGSIAAARPPSISK